MPRRGDDFSVSGKLFESNGMNSGISGLLKLYEEEDPFGRNVLSREYDRLIQRGKTIVLCNPSYLPLNYTRVQLDKEGNEHIYWDLLSACDEKAARVYFTAPGSGLFSVKKGKLGVIGRKGEFLPCFNSLNLTLDTISFFIGDKEDMKHLETQVGPTQLLNPPLLENLLEDKRLVFGFLDKYLPEVVLPWCWSEALSYKAVTRAMDNLGSDMIVGKPARGSLGKGVTFFSSGMAERDISGLIAQAGYLKDTDRWVFQAYEPSICSFSGQDSHTSIRAISFGTYLGGYVHGYCRTLPAEGKDAASLNRTAIVNLDKGATPKEIPSSHQAMVLEQSGKLDMAFNNIYDHTLIEIEHWVAAKQISHHYLF
ncbi:MAG: hypothetical protein HGA85_02810 [Nanoarchaeota archaeon]|nr:hypothetical protein [Nanoarchaeota archaeon]